MKINLQEIHVAIITFIWVFIEILVGTWSNMIDQKCLAKHYYQSYDISIIRKRNERDRGLLSLNIKSLSTDSNIFWGKPKLVLLLILFLFHRDYTKVCPLNQQNITTLHIFIEQSFVFLACMMYQSVAWKNWCIGLQGVRISGGNAVIE